MFEKYMSRVLFYEEYLNDLCEDTAVELDEKTIERLSIRSSQLEKDAEFSSDEIFDELMICVPAIIRDNGSVQEFLDQLSNFIVSQMEEFEDDLEEEEDYD